MINLINILLVYGVVILVMNNISLRNKIKYNKEFYEIDKKLAIELALVNAEMNKTYEKYIKNCEEFKEMIENGKEN
ncbi:hypothetical protein [Clostridium taeniosporum]|uniref:Uncharacterized protein n=1 Tax=Clostridium taeniosporum TaxID=394958 RepID=A0A1D7XKL6_9CLOT|nr:hypothetical protein [Clostridium taeniosporum]AOR23888.1 hypothetical protein BGI42_09195 [Clostridium taeniosporum]